MVPVAQSAGVVGDGHPPGESDPIVFGQGRLHGIGESALGAADFPNQVGKGGRVFQGQVRALPKKELDRVASVTQ